MTEVPSSSSENYVQRVVDSYTVSKGSLSAHELYAVYYGALQGISIEEAGKRLGHSFKDLPSEQKLEAVKALYIGHASNKKAKDAVLLGQKEQEEDAEPSSIKTIALIEEQLDSLSTAANLKGVLNHRRDNLQTLEDAMSFMSYLVSNVSPQDQIERLQDICLTLGLYSDTISVVSDEAQAALMKERGSALLTAWNSGYVPPNEGF